MLAEHAHSPVNETPLLQIHRVFGVGVGRDIKREDFEFLIYGTDGKVLEILGTPPDFGAAHAEAAVGARRPLPQTGFLDRESHRLPALADQPGGNLYQPSAYHCWYGTKFALNFQSLRTITYSSVFSPRLHSVMLASAGNESPNIAPASVSIVRRRMVDFMVRITQTGCAESA
jgi:hypothetical protein